MFNPQNSDKQSDHRVTLPVTFRHRVIPHDPGVWLSTVRDGPHLQGGDHPGQEQGSVQGALHGLF